MSEAKPWISLGLCAALLGGCEAGVRMFVIADKNCVLELLRLRYGTIYENPAGFYSFRVPNGHGQWAVMFRPDGVADFESRVGLSAANANRLRVLNRVCEEHRSLGQALQRCSSAPISWSLFQADAPECLALRPKR